MRYLGMLALLVATLTGRQPVINIPNHLRPPRMLPPHRRIEKRRTRLSQRVNRKAGRENKSHHPVSNRWRSTIR